MTGLFFTSLREVLRIDYLRFCDFVNVRFGIHSGVIQHTINLLRSVLAVIKHVSFNILVGMLPALHTIALH
jgi:hypothetical protein